MTEPLNSADDLMLELVNCNCSEWLQPLLEKLEIFEVIFLSFKDNI